MYATMKPATLALFMGLSMNTNAMQSMRAVHMLIALTGNVDVKGGHIVFDLTHVPARRGALRALYLPREEMAKAPGVKERPMYYGYDAMVAAHSQ